MKKKIFALLLCAAMLFGAMVSSTPFAAAENEDASTEAEVVKEDGTKVLSCDNLFGDGVTEFERVAAAGDLELYFTTVNKKVKRNVQSVVDGKITETAGEVAAAGHIFAIKNVKTEQVWYSIPADAAKVSSAVKLDEMMSTITIDCIDRNSVLTSSYATQAVKANNCTVKKLKDGVTIQYVIDESNKGYKATIPLTITLNDKGIRASIDMAAIKFEGDKNCKLLDISVLPYFGCGKQGVDGYMFVPDGSGALIDNNYVNPNGIVQEYYTYVYDRDPTLSVTVKTDVTEPTILPVFGTKMSDDMAWLAVIEEGDALATIRASYARNSIPFTSQYAEFTYRAKDVFKTSDRYYQRDYDQYAVKSSDCEIAIGYYLLSGEDADYVGMANTYRDYLIAEGAVADKNNISADLEMYIETYGAITKKVSKFGFVVDELTAVTTFKQATAMVEAFKKAGVSNINLRYSGWMTDGMDNVPVVDAKAEGVVGSTEDMLALNKALGTAGGELFLNLEVLETTDSRAGWSLNKYTVRNMINEVFENPRICIVTGMTLDDYTYFTTPTKIQEQVDSFNKDFKDYGIKSLSAGSLGSLVYSDFTTNTDRFSSRQNTEEYIKKTLAGLAESTDNLMVEKGNGYSLAYADTVLNIPLYDSGFEITDTDVPFVQIALHGLVNYTESAHNQTTSDKQTQLLRQLETGAAPYYLLTAEKTSIFLENILVSKNFSTEYTVWLDSAAKDFKVLSGVLNGYCDKPITDHRIITDDVRATTYGGAMTVYVNYSGEDYTTDGVTVPARGYITVKEAA